MSEARYEPIKHHPCVTKYQAALKYSWEIRCCGKFVSNHKTWAEAQERAMSLAGPPE
jgi:hypothetical protein